MFKKTSSRALLVGAILSLLMTLLGVAALLFIAGLDVAGDPTVQILRGAAGFLTGLSLFYAGGLLWLWVRRRHPEAVEKKAAKAA